MKAPTGARAAKELILDALGLARADGPRVIHPGTHDSDMIALAECEAFQFDLYVDENWRGRRVAAKVWSAMHLFEKQHGCTAAYSKVSLLNRKSQRAAGRAGWSTSGTVLRVVGSRRGGVADNRVLGFRAPTGTVAQQVRGLPPVIYSERRLRSITSAQRSARSRGCRKRRSDGRGAPGCRDSARIVVARRRQLGR
jgi:hypothetical protein